MKNNKIVIGIIIVALLVGTIGIKAAQLVTSGQVIYKDNQTVDVALNNLFEDLQEGKELLAEAISNQGVETTGENTLSEMAYNVNSINNSMEWKLAGNATGNSIITLPSEFNEISVMVYANSEWYTFNIPKIQLTSESNSYTNGYSAYDSNKVAYYRHIRINASLTEVSISKAVMSDSYNGLSDKTSTAIINVYYR